MTSKNSMRLALRVEGDFWNAYIASPDTMDNALLIGSIRIGVVHSAPELKAIFMATMQAATAAALAVTGATDFGWNDPVPAPPHEKAGRA